MINIKGMGFITPTRISQPQFDTKQQITNNVLLAQFNTTLISTKRHQDNKSNNSSRHMPLPHMNLTCYDKTANPFSSRNLPFSSGNKLLFSQERTKRNLSKPTISDWTNQMKHNLLQSVYQPKFTHTEAQNDSIFDEEANSRLTTNQLVIKVTSSSMIIKTRNTTRLLIS